LSHAQVEPGRQGREFFVSPPRRADCRAEIRNLPLQLAGGQAQQRFGLREQVAFPDTEQRETACFTGRLYGITEEFSFRRMNHCMRCQGGFKRNGRPAGTGEKRAAGNGESIGGQAGDGGLQGAPCERVCSTGTLTDKNRCVACSHLLRGMIRLKRTPNAGIGNFEAMSANNCGRRDWATQSDKYHPA